MARSTLSQAKTAQVNTFTGGINTDLHPLIQPNDTLTDCVNGTIITYNGNENMLQNDMGNYELKNAKLPSGYIPMGIKEYQGIIYIVSMNPITNKIQIGSYPSPQVSFGDEGVEESYSLNCIDIGTTEDFDRFAALYKEHVLHQSIGSDDSLDSDGSFSDDPFFIWQLIDFDPVKFTDLREDIKSEIQEIQKKLLYTKVDTSQSSVLFTKDFGTNTMLTCGDKYKLNLDVSERYFEQAPFQNFEYFTLDNNKNVTVIDEDDIYYTSDQEFLSEYEDSYKQVSWKSDGWLGARFVLEDIPQIEQNVSRTSIINDVPHISEYSKTTDVSQLDENSCFEYKFKIEGFESLNKVIDFEQFAKGHQNDLVIVSGNAKFKGSSVTIIQDNEYIGVETLTDNVVYRLEGQYRSSINTVVSNELYDFVGISTGPITYYIHKTLDVSKIKSGQTIQLVETDVNASFEKLPINIIGKATDIECTIKCPKGKKEYYQNIFKQRFDSTTKISFEEYDSITSQLVNEKLDDYSYRLLAPSENVSDTKIGLNGVFDNGIYTLAETDSADALSKFVATLVGCSVILPSTMKLASIEYSRGMYIGNAKTMLIIPHEFAEELTISADILHKPIIYTDNDVNKFKFYNRGRKEDYPSDKIYKMRDFQFQNFEIESSTDDYYKPSIHSVKLEEDNGLFLTVSVSMGDNISSDDSFGKDMGGNDFKGIYAFAYGYLFSNIKIKGNIRTWFKAGDGLLGEKIISLKTRRFNDWTYFPSIYIDVISGQSYSYYVVPETFLGKLDGRDVSVDKNEPVAWNQDNAVFSYKISSPNSSQRVSLGVTVSNTEGNKVFTKICVPTQNGETISYHDASSGNVQHTYEATSVDACVIDSVPVKILDSGHMLIYDNKTCRDTINTSAENTTTVVGYDYYVENNELYVSIEASYAMIYSEVADSVKIYMCDNNNFIKRNCYTTILGNSFQYVGDKIDFKVSGIQNLLNHDFIFMYVYLDADDFEILPVNTKVTKDFRDNLIRGGITNFTKLYADQFPQNYVVSTTLEDCTTEHKYITAQLSDNGSLKVLHESNLPYYWYNGLLGNNSTSSNTETYYFGEAERVKGRINLTKLGITEGSILNISGGDTDYTNILVSANNSDLFSKENGIIYFNIDSIGAYNIHPYNITFGGDAPILNRQYLIKHNGPPITHNDADLGWTDVPLRKYAGWEDDVSRYKTISVGKADACNSNVHIGTTSLDTYSEENETFDLGPVLTNKSQIKNAVSKVIGPSDECKQLFTIINARITVDKSGLTIPIPKMSTGDYNYSVDGGKNKKNKDTEDAIVITRESSGGWHRAGNVIHKFIAYSGIVGGVAAVAGAVVAGVIAAGAAAATATTVAVATAAAAAACIPFVGWALLAAAVLAASIILLTKATAGKDQNFQFYTIRGPECSLAIPLWGNHLSAKKDGKAPEKDGQKWADKEKNRYPAHPWYLNPHYTKAEELIVYILTHVFYQKEVGKGKIEKSSSESKQNSVVELSLKVLHSVNSNSWLEKYSFIQNRISESNNFKILNPQTTNDFTITFEGSSNITNKDYQCWGYDENGKSFVTDTKLPTYSIDKVVEFAEEDGYDADTVKEIQEELESFVKNLGGSGKDVYYNGQINYSEQEAFGGNTGGRWSRLKCATKDGANTRIMRKMVAGEYPRNDLGYTPVAYGIKTSSDDKLMVKDLGWTSLNSDWGQSKSKYLAGTDPSDAHEEFGSKYLDYIKWNSYSEEFKLTCNTNDI